MRSGQGWRWSVERWFGRASTEPSASSCGSQAPERTVHEQAAREWDEAVSDPPLWMHSGDRANRLAEAFDLLDPAAQKLAKPDSLDAVSRSLRQCACELLDAPSRQAAAQAWRFHLQWSQRLGRVCPEDLESAAQAAGAVAWWEEAGLWSEGLVALAAKGAPMNVSDQTALDWCWRLALDFHQVLPYGSDDDERELASLVNGRKGAGWRARAAWPWPTRPVDAETKEWARRKWEQSLIFSDQEALGAEMERVPVGAPWLDLARALIRSKSAGAPVQSRCGRALLAELEAREQERQLRQIAPAPANPKLASRL